MTATPHAGSRVIHADDGRAFVLRALESTDLPALHRAFQRLTPEEVEYRFFYRSRELPVSIQSLVKNLDPTRDAGFVLEAAGEIRAVADLHLDHPGATEAEFGLIVGQAVAGHGLGRILLERLLDEARARRVALLGLVRSDNVRMLELCRRLGGSAAMDPGDPGVLRVRFAWPT
ncbi:MAG TPA: GNAT family N-acetyltransferase [Rhodanobacteraceae bacterium]